MKHNSNPDNDSFDPSEEYFRERSQEEEDKPYFPLEESPPPHY